MQRSHCLWIAVLLVAAAAWAQQQGAESGRRLSVSEPLEIAWTRGAGCYGTTDFRIDLRSDGRRFRYRAELRARKSFISEESRTEALEGEISGRELALLLQVLDRPETWRETPPGVIGGGACSVEARTPSWSARVREVDFRIARRVEAQTVVGNVETLLRVRMGLPGQPGPD